MSVPAALSGLPESLPHDRDLERGVLAAAVLDPVAAREVADGLTPGDLWQPEHRTILRAIAALVEAGGTPDLLSLTHDLRTAGRLEAAGGASYLSGLLDVVPDVISVSTHIGKLQEMAARRRMLEVFTRASTAVQGGQGLEYACKVAAELASIAETGRPRRSVLEEHLAPVGLAALTEDPPPRSWVFRQPGGDGLLPRGRVGILASAGGCGKTTALLAAAVAIVTGRAWLGHFQVDDRAAGGRVLLLLAEEDFDELARRLWKLAERLRLSPAERQDCASRIVVACLAGVSIQLTTARDGVLCESAELGDLRRLLNDGGEPWTLVGIDPLSRFAAGDFEISSESATRVVQAAESLCDVPGHPAVLLSAHSSKYARRAGTADVRGAGALTDAARWVATLKAVEGGVILEQVKSNYSMPTPPVPLRWADGVLLALSSEELEHEAKRAEHERAERIAEETEADILGVLEALRREGGTIASKSAIGTAAGMRAQRARNAVDLAIGRGLVIRTGTARDVRYTLAVPGVCVSNPPYTPRDRGTAIGASRGPRSEDSRDGLGTGGTAGPATAEEPGSEGKGSPDPGDVLSFPDQWSPDQRRRLEELQRDGLTPADAARRVLREVTS